MKTPRVDETIKLLTQTGFRQHFGEPVDYKLDHTVWKRFDETHHFDLYGGDEPFAWSDWVELKFETRA